MPIAVDIAAQLPADAFVNLDRADRLWHNLRHGQIDRREMVVSSDEYLKTIDVDIAIAGGTLGIILAAALQLRGLQVAVIERGELKGRAQEWNISRAELAVLVEVTTLTANRITDVAGSSLTSQLEFLASRAEYPLSLHKLTRCVLTVLCKTN